MKLFKKTPSQTRMKTAILSSNGKTWDNSDYLQEVFPSKTEFLKRIKDNMETYNETELIRSYYQTKTSYV